MGTASEAMARLVVVHEATVRKKAEVGSRVKGTLQVGEVVTVLEQAQSKGHQRVRIGDGRWVSRETAAGRVLLQPVGGEPGAKVDTEANAEPWPPAAAVDEEDPLGDFNEGCCGCFGDLGACEYHCKPWHPLGFVSSPLLNSVANHQKRLHVCTKGLFAVFCPHIVSMEIAAEVDANSCLHCLGSCSLFSGGICPLFVITGCLLRKNFRKYKYIRGSRTEDLVCGGIFHWCSLCQMARELEGAKVGVQQMER